MKRLVMVLLVAALLAPPLEAQRGGGTRRVTSILPECTATSGSCPADDYQCKVTASQQIWSCTVPSTWTEVANATGGGGGSSTFSGLTDTNISSPSAGQVPIYDGIDTWDNVSLSGDVTVSSSGVCTIGANAVALGTDTTGGYAASTTEGGPATTATALAANGGNCSAGNYPLGVDASGAVEGCTADSTTPAAGEFGNATDLDANGAVLANAVALGTDTTGNYAAGDAEAGNATGLACTNCVGVTDLDQGIVPTWSGAHIFGESVTLRDSLLHDWDADGNYEWVTVGPDYDGDSSAEMVDDIWAAITDYCGDGSAITSCPEGGLRMTVLAADYQPPAADNGETTYGIIELPSNFWLDLSPGAILNGFDNTVASATGDQAAVAIVGQSDVRMSGGEIDGEMNQSASDLDALTGPRMGVYIRDDAGTPSRRVHVHDMYIHDTRHTCLYAKNSQDILFEANYVQRCGWAGAGTSTQPGIYIFADSSTQPMQYAQVNQNFIDAPQAPGINFRIDDASTDTLRYISAFQNQIYDPRDGQPGLEMRGCSRCTFKSTLVVNGDGVRFTNGTVNLYTDGQGPGTGTNHNATEFSSVDGLDVYLDSTDEWCANIGTYHIAPSITRMNCYGTGSGGGDGLLIEQPSRRVTVGEITLNNVDDGITFANNHPNNYDNSNLTENDEWVRFDNVSIAGAAGDPVEIRAVEVVDVTFNGFNVSDFAANTTGAIQFINTDISDLHFSDWEVTMDGANTRFFNVRLDATRLTWEGMRFYDQGSGQHAIHGETGDDCIDCIITDIFYEGGSSGGGAIQFDSTDIDLNDLLISDVLCVDHVSDCVDLADFGAETRIGQATDEAAWYKVHGATGANDCPTASGTVAGSLCSDRDGDGSTSCAGSAECFFFISDGSTWTGYPQ